MPVVTLRGFISVVALLGLLSFMPAYAAEVSWLVGKWEMTQDPDGNDKDWMEFTPEGQATSIAPSGRRVPGRYEVTDNEVRIVYTVNGKSIPITLKYSADKKRLLAYSKKTGNTSVYEKVR